MDNMNIDKMRTDILNDLQEKVNDIYLKYQERLYIKTGDIMPTSAYQQDVTIERLAHIITDVLISEMG